MRSSNAAPRKPNARAGLIVPLFASLFLVTCFARHGQGPAASTAAQGAVRGAGKGATVPPGAAAEPGEGAADTSSITAAVTPNFRSALRRLDGPERSLGHAGGRWSMTRYANDGGESAGSSATAAAGSVIVLEATSPEGPLFVMQKRAHGYDPQHGDWHYAVIDRKMNVLREGKLADCSGCHLTAKNDSVFGAATRANRMRQPAPSTSE